MSESSYAADVERVRQIIERISRKDCDIDEMLGLVNTATELIGRCREKLAKTGLQVRTALDRLSEMGDGRESGADRI